MQIPSNDLCGYQARPLVVWFQVYGFFLQPVSRSYLVSSFILFLIARLLSHRKADIALIGLAVMGQNLILNMDSHGYVVCAYNRTVDKVMLDNCAFDPRLV